VSSPRPPLVRTRIEGPALHPDSPFTSLVKERYFLPVFREPSMVTGGGRLVKDVVGPPISVSRFEFRPRGRGRIPNKSRGSGRGSSRGRAERGHPLPKTSRR